MTTPVNSERVAASLNELLSAGGLPTLASELAGRFAAYLSLILRWNTRINLTAIRNPEQILSRHFLESIAAAQALPAGIVTLLDLGSGAGMPGIPIALCRPEITVTLAESQNKKAAFLQEAVRTLHLNVQVFAGRAENLAEQFDCVALRAVDRMGQAIATAAALVREDGWLAVLTTSADLSSLQKGAAGFHWQTPVPIPGSERRVLALGQKAPNLSN